MEILHLVVALSSGIVASLAVVLPIFNRGLKEELEILGREKAELESAAERFEKRLLEKDKKIQKLRESLEAADSEADAERRKTRGQRGDGRKAQDLERDFRRKEELLGRQLSESEKALKEVQAELLEQKQRVAKMGEDLAVAGADAAQFRMALERAQATPATPQPAPAQAPAPESSAGNENELAELRQALSKLKKELKTRSLGEKTIKRKLEHNRRAYMVTMMQLDLANDELCLIKTGKPRRQTALVRQQMPGTLPEPEVDEPETVDDLNEEMPAVADLVIDLTGAVPEEEVAPEVVEEAPAEEDAEVVEEAPAEEDAEVVEEAPAEEDAEVVEEAPAEEDAEVVEEAPAEEEEPTT